MTEIIKAVIFGHAVADALGVPVEFMSRDSLDRDPVVSMRGFGTYNVPAGSWSDDTSMAIATLDSLGQGRIDYNDIMDKFVAWANKGEYTPTGWRFDAGCTCLDAIWNYQKGSSPLKCGIADDYSNGNGSLMRIHPVALYLYCKGITDARGIEIIHNVSRLTHAHPRSKIACGIYTFVLWELLRDPSRASVIRGLRLAADFYGDSKYSKTEDFLLYERMLLNRIGGINGQGNSSESARSVKREEIKSTGYVLDTLEATIWCLLTTDSYRDCVLTAVNLGEDTDTVAAIAGGLAAALYGYDSIPDEWLTTLIKRDYIDDLCTTAASAWCR